MPKLFQLHRPDLAADLVAALAACQTVRDHQRLLAMRLAASGQLTAAQIAETVGLSRRQFFNWVTAFQAGGVAGLLARAHGGGPPPRVTGAALTELQAGLQTGRWKRAKEIQAWLHGQHKTALSLQGVYYWLGKLRAVLKVPRKAHALQTPGAAAAFQRTLCEKLENLKLAGGRPVRVWVADEHRYGLLPVVRRCWTLRGTRPTTPYQTKYEWGYLYSALEVDGDHAAEFLCLPSVSLELTHLFLEQVAARDPGAEHVVIWDRAGFHPDPELHVVPAHIHLVPLPAFSPELNPVEIIGDLIKDRIANTLWPTLEALEEALGEELRPLYQCAERVRQLVSHPWLADQVNATAPLNSAFM